ncbi:MAG: hypothetical protein KC996_06390 [Phycisphaerales bacterium]|nr:hypothetical protein [Phycisphaerales bacterium]
MNTPRPATLTATLLAHAILAAILLPASGCSDSSSGTPATPANDIDSSYLDELEREQAPEPEPTPVIEDEPVEITQAVPQEQDRQWEAEQGSKSTLGKTRDRAKDLANRIKDGTTPDNGIAFTRSEDEYANSSGYRWDMPEDWRMAVPSSGHFAEMYINHPLGNASVAFSKERGSVQEIIRSLQSTLVSDIGGRTKADTTTKTVLGLPVTIVDMKGTYVDPAGKGGRNESPFYAIHAAIIELPDTRILINMWGPEDTVAQSSGKFNAMLERMIQE